MSARSGDAGAGTRLQSSFDQIAVGIAHTTTDGRILEVNRKLCELLGYSAAELLAMTTRDLTHPDDRDRQDNLRLELLARARSAFSGDKRYLHKDGSVIWVNRTVALARETPDGEPYLIQTIDSIDARKNADAAAAQLAAIIEGSNDAIISRGLDRKVRTWNTAAEKMLGFTAEEIIGQPVDCIIPDDQRPQAGQMGALLDAGKATPAHDTVRLTKDGRRIDVSVAQSPIKDANGTVIGASITFHDITARKQAEQQSQENERRYRETFDQVAVGIAHTSLDGKYLKVNRKFCKMLGYDESDIVGHAAAEFTHPDDPSKGLQYRQLLWDGKLDNFSEEKRYIRKDGSVLSTNRTVSLARDTSGKPMYFIRVLEDISERVAAEVRDRATFDNAPVGIMHTSIDGYRILRANPKLCQMLGYTQDEMLRMTSTDVVHPDYRFTDAPSYQDQMLTGELQTFASERVFVRKDGTPIRVNRTISLVKDAAGKPDYFIRVIEDITARKHAEEVRANLAAIVESANVAIFGRTLDGTITTWNAGAERLFGYTATEAVGRPATFNLAPGREPALARNTEIILRGEATAPVESKRLAKDGRLIDVLTSHSPIRDSAGNIVGASVILHDITERKQAEEARANLAAIVENANDAIVSRSPDDTIRSWNKAAERMFGWSAQEAIGQPITLITAPEYRGKVRPFVERAMRGETVAPIESFNRRRDGSLVETSVTFSPSRDATGKVVSLSIFFRDITQQKRAVEAWHRLASIVDSSNDAIIGRGLDGKIESWNPAAERLFGWTAAEAIGQKSSMLVPPDSDYEEQAVRNRALLAQGHAVIDNDTVRLTKDGQRIPVSLTLSPINNASGTLIGASVVYRDISERRRGEEALRESERRLSALFANLPGMAYGCKSDPNWTMTIVSEGCEAVTGYKQSELQQNRTVAYGDLIHSEDRDTLSAKCEASLDAHTPCSNEYRIIAKSGEVRWVWDRAEGVYAADGTLLGIEGFVQDITERKRAEEMIIRERTLLRTIIDALPDLIYVKDRAGSFVLANKAWLAARGAQDEDIAGKTVLDYFPRNIAVGLIAQDRSVVETGMPLLNIEQKLIVKRKDEQQSETRWGSTTKVPLRTATGEIIGTAGISRDITEQKQFVARQAMEYTVTRVLAESATLEEAMRNVLRTICQALDWTCGAHWTWDETDQLLRCAETWYAGSESVAAFVAASRKDANEAPAWIDGTAPGIASGGVVRRVWFSGVPAWIPDVMQMPDFRRGPTASEAGLHSAFGFPILAGAQPLGVMEFYGGEIKRPDEALLKMVEAIGSQIGQFIQRKEAEGKLAFLAQFDTVTGLPNRFLFIDRLGQMLTQSQRSNRSVGVLFMDLDRFKAVNDTYGHAVGDQLLRQVGARMEQCTRSGDTVGRLSGDEFAVMLSNLAQAEDAGLVAQKMVTALAAPFDLDGHQAYISASIGIAVYPGDGSEPDQLLKNADTAMYRVKEQGRNGYQFYLPQMNERVIQRQRIDAQLRGALDRQEFVLHYQPKVSLMTGAITGFEALLRWQRGEVLVPPFEFISILEETGLIVPVGEWVLRSACEQIKRWEQKGITPRPVAVNVSARQFQRNNLADVVEQVLRESGINPALLRLELTESLLMSDAKEAVEALHQLKDLGVQLSVDDFGTGYSSLAYLKRFPLDELKIDRAFIRDTVSDPDDAAIALTIINIGRSLKLTVVAEGVETEGQLNFLRLHGCDEMQGFLFARPLPVEECTRMLTEDRRLHLPESGTAKDAVTLLLVGENEDEMHRLTQAFAPAGFRVLTAKSASDGFEILASRGADIVISDNDMSGMSGIEFLTRIRTLYSKTVRVLVSSGDDAPTLTRATNKAGIHLFLPKSWAPDRLCAEVREIMRARSDAAAASSPSPGPVHPEGTAPR